MSIKIDLQYLMGLETTIEEISIFDLEVDPEIQRDLERNKVLTIFKEFVPAAVGVLTVSRRANRQIVILDGQHRHDVLLKKAPEGGPDKVTCRVFTGLNKNQEAALFLALNHSTKPSATAKFRIQGTAGDPGTLAIYEILDQYGYTVGTNTTNGTVAAVKTLERIYRLSQKRKWEPNLLLLTLLVLNRAFGKDYDATRGVMLEAVSALLDEYPTNLDIDRLVEKLRSYGTANMVVTEGYSLAHSLGLRPAMGIAQVIVEKIYNRGPGRKLTQWRRRR